MSGHYPKEATFTPQGEILAAVTVSATADGQPLVLEQSGPVRITLVRNDGAVLGPRAAALVEAARAFQTHHDFCPGDCGPRGGEWHSAERLAAEDALRDALKAYDA